MFAIVEAAVAADRDQCVELVRPEGLEDLVGTVLIDRHAARERFRDLERIALVDGAENRTAEMADVSHRLGC